MARVETPYAPITDRGAAYGFNRWTKMAEKLGKKPVYGFEVAVTDSPNAKMLNLNHVTLVATSNLAPLNKLIELAFSKFKYEPLITYADLNLLDPSVRVILGRRIDFDLLDKQRQWYYAAGPSTMPKMVRAANEIGILPVASSDNLYPSPEDRHPFQLLLGRQASSQTWPQHILTDDELRAYAPQEAFDNRDAMAAECTASMRMSKLVTPQTDMDMRGWCLQGAKELNIDLEDEVYKARLEREYEVIDQLGFEDYFLIIADLVQYSKTQMFVGPARGSSAGSLVCFLMGITTVDPIVHDLLFERFLDLGRSDLPDIDIDFSDQNRDKAFTYLSDKYGRDRVARLGTVSFLREKAVAKEIGAGLGIPAFKFEAMIQNVETNEGNTTVDMVLRNTQDGIKLLREFPELEVVKRVEGHPRHHSTHAAGVIVTDEPVHHYVAVDARNNTAEVDKKDAEDLEMLKIDALGLKQLSIFEDCLKLIGKSNEWLINIPLDDPKAFNVLNQGLFSGVFQYNGRAVQQVSSSFTIDNFEDMVATTALARPGPLGAGGTDKWIAVRRGEAEVAFEHPAFVSIVGKTKGIVLYQEQVMQAGRDIGGMTWPRVTKLRKAVQYFGGAAGMEEFRDEFMAGATERGIPIEGATRFWDDLLTYGSYAFNRSHAVAYSMISYWCCYLKAHHTKEYAAAMLNHASDSSKQRIMLKEIAREGVTYKPVDPETSGLKWQVTKAGLVGPITLVKGLGAKTARDYVRARDNGTAIPKRALTLLADPATPLDSLSPISDKIKDNYPDLSEINIFSEPTAVEDLPSHSQKGLLLFLRLLKATPRKDPKSGGTKMTALMEDDTGEIKVFFNHRKYDEYSDKIMNSGKVGKTLWAVKGSQPDGGGIIFCDMIRFLGEFQ